MEAEEEYVCTLCFKGIPSLEKFIEEKKISGKCQHHQSSEHPAVPLKDLVARMLESIKERFEPCTGKKTWPIEDILIRSPLFIPEADFTKYIVNAIPEKHWRLKCGLPLDKNSDALSFYYDCFKYYAKKHCPDFLDDTKIFGNVTYGDLIESISKIIKKQKMVVPLKCNTSLCRTRIDAENHYQKVEDLCPPPKNKAKANRMSHAGIPMFYCAKDEKTALLETIDSDSISHKATIATFENTKDLTIIDFTKKLPQRDFFSEESDKEAVLFLEDFLKDMSKPIEKDGREHIEYAPTQRLVKALRGKFEIDGIAYRSSRNGKKCYVFFYDRSAFIGENPLFTIPGLLKNIEISPALFNKKLEELCDKLCRNASPGVAL